MATLPASAFPTGQPASVQQDLYDIAIHKLYQVEAMFLPKAWNAAPDMNLKWEVSAFPPDPRKVIPDEPGVYVFVAEVRLFGFPHGSGLFYIGKATSLYSRIGAYIDDQDKDFVKTKRPKVWSMINAWRGHLRYYFTRTPTVKEAEDLEEHMLAAYIPPFNTHFDGELGPLMKAF
jgi:hypothetical protein